MLRFKQKVESVMSSEGVCDAFSLASWLLLISFFYDVGQKLRGICYRWRIMPSRKLPCKVISIGNIVVGGTGKTPLTIQVAAAIQRFGYKVAVVSRGYKGSAERHGGIVGDGEAVLMNAAQAGDEPCLIARRTKGVPVIVGKDRHAAGMLAVRRFKPDVIVLDDAFQHLKLTRDLDLVLLDCRQPFGNSHLLPRGTLREPISSLARSSACIMTRCRADAADEKNPAIGAVERLVPERPVFTSTHVPYCYLVKKEDRFSADTMLEFLSPEEMAEIKNKKIYAFSGIARNDDFRHTLERLGFNVTGFREYSDHHHYTESDLEGILNHARASGAGRLITTEKDHVRIAHINNLPVDLVVVGVKISFGNDEEKFMAFIKNGLGLC